ncbi:hypothetical protein H4219_002236 [Mycoemilia scoparia]|uniref:Uncharacterized protein n=1 Tax=Mycoemilia scoparia TaxID=417184 RepID=A0A9W8A3Y6_9FUNG|nr:hypothetical protein H4219_002236 [Mycoemilia scoparia]
MEKAGQWQKANDIYETTLGFYRQELDSKAVLVVPKTMSSHTEEIVNWADELLYRRCFVALKLGAHRETYQRLYDYLNHMANVTPPQFRIHRRIQASYTLIRAIPYAHRKGEYEPHGGPQNVPNAPFVPNSVRQELVLLHCEHTALLRVGFDFPAADTYNLPVLEAVDQAVSDWELIKANGPNDLVRLLQILYSASQFTFNSPRVFRHLINTLIRFGDWHEVKLALNTYIGLVQRQLETQGPNANDPKRTGSTPFDEKKEAPSPPPKNEDQESIHHIIQVIVAGSKVLLTAFNDGTESLRLHKFGTKLQQKYSDQIPKELVTQLHLWRGVTHGMLAANAEERDSRLEHHQKAINNLSIANTTEPDNPEILIQLAFQHASGGRDISVAFKLAKRAVNLDQSNLRAWHLLVLLITARKDYVGALQACELAFKRASQWYSIDKEVQKSSGQQQQQQQNKKGRLSKSGSGPLENNSNGDQVENDSLTMAKHRHTRSASLGGSSSAPLKTGPVEEGIDYLSLKLTYSFIKREVDGPESSLRTHAHLFLLYGRLVGALQQLTLDDASYAILMVSSTMPLPNLNSKTSRRNSFTGLSLGVSGEDGALGGDIKKSVPSYRSAGKGIAQSLAQSIKSGRGIIKSLSGKERNDERTAVSIAGTEKKKFSRRFRQSMHAFGIHGRRNSHGGTTTTPGIADSLAASNPNIAQGGNLSCPSPFRDGSANALSQSVDHLCTNASTLSLQYRNQGLATASLVDQASSVSLPQEYNVYYRPTITRSRLRKEQSTNLLCDLWLFSATCFIQLEQYEDALQAIEEASTANPKSPAVFSTRGQVYLKQQRHDEATAEFNAAFSISPGEPESTMGLARTRCECGSKEAAAGLLISLTSGKGWNNPEAWYWLGVIERKLAEDMSASAPESVHISKPQQQLQYHHQAPSSPPRSPPPSQSHHNAGSGDPSTSAPGVGGGSNDMMNGLVNNTTTIFQIPIQTYKPSDNSSSEDLSPIDPSNQKQPQQRRQKTLNPGWNRAKEFMAYALDMEQTQPVRDFECLPHLL